MRLIPTVVLAMTIGLAGSGAAVAADAGALAAYAGKYPFDKVKGVGFLKQPAVVKGVKQAVGDQDARGWVLNEDTTQMPIVVRDGTLLSQACEPHNCGDHIWTIVIDLGSGATDVCYFDGATMNAGEALWYLSSGQTETRSGDCPSE